MIGRGAVAAALCAALCASSGARAEEARPAPKKLRIALDRLRAVRVAAALAEAVEERVCAALAEVSRADVVCPADVSAAATLAKSAMVFGECQSDECLRRVDEVRSADRRVSGAIERGEKGLVLSLQLTAPDGSGARVVERLPDDLDAIIARLPAAVKTLFP